HTSSLLPWLLLLVLHRFFRPPCLFYCLHRFFVPRSSVIALQMGCSSGTDLGRVRAEALQRGRRSARSMESRSCRPHPASNWSRSFAPLPFFPFSSFLLLLSLLILSVLLLLILLLAAHALISPIFLNICFFLQFPCLNLFNSAREMDEVEKDMRKTALLHVV